MKKIFALILALSTTGCANYFIKKDCESTNWFEHGQKVAQSGKWLNADKKVMDCRRVEAEIQESQLDQGFKSGVQKYCNNDGAYQVGKGGDIFSRDLCEGPQINVLLQYYKKGINDYCAKTNGQNAGSSGKKYQGVCPKELEPAFLVEYRIGRKRYISAVIENKKDSLRTIENNLATAQGSLSAEERHLTTLRMVESSLQNQVNATSLQNTAFRASLETQLNTAKSNTNDQQSRVSRTRSEISSYESQRNTLNSEIAELRTELATLN